MKAALGRDLDNRLAAEAARLRLTPQDLVRYLVARGLAGLYRSLEGPAEPVEDRNGPANSDGEPLRRGLASASSPPSATTKEETDSTKPAQEAGSERDRAEAAVAELERQLAAARATYAATVRESPQTGRIPQETKGSGPGPEPVGGVVLNEDEISRNSLKEREKCPVPNGRVDPCSTPLLDPPARPPEPAPIWPFPRGTKAKVSRLPKLEFGPTGEQGVVELPAVLGEPLRDLFCPHCHATERGARACAKRMIERGEWGPGDKPKNEPEALPGLPADMAEWPGMAEAWRLRLSERAARGSRGRLVPSQVEAQFKKLRKVSEVHNPETAVACVLSATERADDGVVQPWQLDPAWRGAVRVETSVGQGSERFEDLAPDDPFREAWTYYHGYLDKAEQSVFQPDPHRITAYRAALQHSSHKDILSALRGWRYEDWPRRKEPHLHTFERLIADRRAVEKFAALHRLELVDQERELLQSFTPEERRCWDLYGCNYVPNWAEEKTEELVQG